MSIRIVEFDSVDEALEYEQKKAKSKGAKPVDEEPEVAPPQEKPLHRYKRHYPHNIKPEKRSYTNSERVRLLIPQMIAMHKAGKTYKNIADKLHVSPTTVFRCMRDAKPDVTPEKVVVVVKDGRKTAKWRQMKYKPYTPEEIAFVKAEFEKRGEFTSRDLKVVARKMKVQHNRVISIYYRNIKQWKAEQPQPQVKHEAYTPQEIDDVTQFAKDATRNSHGNLKKGTIKKFAREKGMTVHRVQAILDRVKISGALGEEAIKTKRHRFLWQRVTAMQKQDPNASINILFSRACDEWQQSGRLGIVSAEGTQKKQEKAKVSDSDLEFPTIYPLDDSAIKVFEQMMIDLIAKRHAKIDYYIASANLQLRQGREWDYATWIEFCKQVLANAKAIARALVGCDSAKIRLEKSGNSLVIKYG